MSPDTDPVFLRDVDLAQKAVALVRQGGFTIDLWETFVLARTQGEFLRSEVDRLSAVVRRKRPLFVGGLLLEAVFSLRKKQGFRARALHEALLRTELPLDAEQAEIIKALWMGTDEFRLPFSAELDDLAKSANRIRTSGSRTDGVEPSAGLDPEVLEDLRQALQLHRAFQEATPGIELWVCLAMTRDDRLEARRMAQRLAREPVVGQLDSSLIAFILRTRSYRDYFREMASALRRYVRTLPIGKYAEDTIEIAVAFLVGTARGREILRPWLEDPRRCAREAALRFEGIVGKAQKYQFALRQTTAA